LDMLPQKALVGKVVLPTAIGGTIAHLLMIDYALKPVLAALGATNMQQGIYVLDTQVQRSEDGAAFSFSLSDDIAERIDAAAETFAEEVEWNARRRAK